MNMKEDNIPHTIYEIQRESLSTIPEKTEEELYQREKEITGNIISGTTISEDEFSIKINGEEEITITPSERKFRYNLGDREITSMNKMFMDCSNLEGIDLSSMDKSKVTDLGSMFARCSKLKTINLSSPNIYTVEKVGNMFGSCESLETLNLRNLDFSGVKTYSLVFSRCNSLKTIIGPIFGIRGSFGFASCPLLTNESAMVIIEGLEEVEETKTIAFNKSTYNTITEEQIKIANDKNWNVVCSS